MNSTRTRPIIPFLVATLGIALFSVMDAVMKALSLAIGTYNALLWRTLVGAIVGGAIFFARRSGWPGKAAMRVHLTRGVLSAIMALLFFWGLVHVPLAQGVALSYIAPLIALYLAAVLLKERIERRAILASLLGFAGVLVILWGQAAAEMGPKAFWGAFAILCSALIYAYNIILMRRQAQLAGPLEVGFFMSLIMACCFLLAAPLYAELPESRHVPAILGAALLAFGSLMLLSWAYARAEAQHLAPVEYTSFIWASLLGFAIFAEPVRPLTVIGAAMIVVACLIAAGRRASPAVEVASGVPGGAG